MKTFENEMLIIPNGKLAESIIDNYAKPDLYARSTISFGVEYGSDVEKTRKVVIDTLKKIPKVIKNNEDYPIQVLFIKMGDFALEMEARFWVEHYIDKFLTKVEATEKIYNNLKKSNIGIPFPTRTVYLKK
jgi:small-conductance mechanosensitive channel